MEVIIPVGMPQGQWLTRNRKTLGSISLVWPAEQKESSKTALVFLRSWVSLDHPLGDTCTISCLVFLLNNLFVKKFKSILEDCHVPRLMS